MNSFTQEDLIQYLYNETSVEKAAAIAAALESDYNLREAMDILTASNEQLKTVKLLSPRQQTLDFILNYAEKSVAEVHA